MHVPCRRCGHGDLTHPGAPCQVCGCGVAWQPHAGPQEQYLAATAAEVLFGGQAGGGKTAGTVAYPLRWCLPSPTLPAEVSSQFRTVIFRRETTQLTKLLDEAQKLYRRFGARARQAGVSKVWTFPTGATVKFTHLELENDVAAYDGDEFQLEEFDELTHFTETQYKGLRARLRSPHALLPRYTRCTSNPGGDGHDWVFRLWGPWLDPKFKVGFLPERRAPDGVLLPPARSGQVLAYVPQLDGSEVWVPPGTRGSVTRTFIPSRLADNPSLMDDEEYQLRLRSLDPVRREQLESGNWLAKPGRGKYFKRSYFRVLESINEDQVIRRVRAWDQAATEPKRGCEPDWTVGVLMALLVGGRVVIEHVIRFRGPPHEVEARLKATAQADGRRVQVRLPQDPGSAGKILAARQLDDLAGYWANAERVTGSKVTRAGPLSSAAGAGRVAILAGPWHEEFFGELEAFPEGAFDDQVDAASDAYAELVPAGFDLRTLVAAK